jgi:molybdopterin converting factor small subunit
MTIRHVSDPLRRDDESANHVTVRYWAAARAAAGVESEVVSATTLAEVLSEISRRHGDRDRFDDVIGTCSMLHGEVPVGSRDPADVLLAAGDCIEFLPPFAGG